MAKARRTDGGFSGTEADRHGHNQPLFVLFCSRNETKKREAASWCPRGYRLPVFPRDFATSCVSFGLLFQAKAEDCYWHRTLESHTFRWETVSYVFHGKIRPTMLASSGRIFRRSGWIVEDETTISSEKFRRHSRTSSDKPANVFSHGQTAGMRNGTRYSSSFLVPLKTDATGFHDRETRVACLFT